MARPGCLGAVVRGPVACVRQLPSGARRANGTVTGAGAVSAAANNPLDGGTRG